MRKQDSTSLLLPLDLTHCLGTRTSLTLPSLDKAEEAVERFHAGHVSFPA